MSAGDSIPTLTALMRKTGFRAVEASVFPPLSESFRRELTELEQAEAADLDALTRLITMAYAALTVSVCRTDEQFGSWYAEMAQRLLCRAMDAISVMAAERGSGVSLN